MHGKHREHVTRSRAAIGRSTTGYQVSMDDRNRQARRDDVATDAERDARPAVADEAQLLQENLKLPPDAAAVTASDLHAGSKRKPASDDVDSARAAEARATENDR
ncbi:MAG: hypothetical protein NVS1B2_00170 [Vulcanimicrobiaceae bacterium]